MAMQIIKMLSFLSQKFNFLKPFLHWPTSIIINACYEDICVEFERKKHPQHWFSCFQIAGKYIKSFETLLLNINLVNSVYDY